MAWERKPSREALWQLIVVSIPKATGGQRPIGLTAIWLRVWSRLRQPLVARWEASLKNPAFWGTSESPCERAGV
eukprot:8649743-Pyramimonas_sp.AAC.1